MVSNGTFNKKKVDVAAALIWDDNRFMICKRPEDKARAGLWEFVGGKLEDEETSEEALTRECREELDCTVKPLDVFMEVNHDYPDLLVHLILHNAQIAEGEPKLIEHQDLRWIKPDEIDDYAFCPADEKILAEIKRRYKANES